MSDDFHGIEMPVAWDVIERPWARYQGNQLYSAAAQIVMDICADCFATLGRLPRLREVKSVSWLSDEQLAQAFTNLAERGWKDYAAIGAELKPRKSAPRRSVKQVIPADVRWIVWQRDDFTCRSCGSRTRLAVDHIYPESKGGETTVENLQTLCVRCNSRKGAAEPIEGEDKS